MESHGKPNHYYKKRGANFSCVSFMIDKNFMECILLNCSIISHGKDGKIMEKVVENHGIFFCNLKSMNHVKGWD